MAQSSSLLDDGGRILRAVVRPYPAKVAGIPKKWSYELNTGRATFSWNEPQAEESNLRCRETEIFFPSMLLENGRNILVDGLPKDAWTYDVNRQTLFIVPPRVSVPSSGAVTREVVIRVDTPLEPLFEMTNHWQDFGLWYLAFVGILMAIVGWWIL